MLPYILGLDLLNLLFLTQNTINHLNQNAWTKDNYKNFSLFNIWGFKIKVPGNHAVYIYCRNRKLKLIGDPAINILLKEWEQREIKPGSLSIKTLNKNNKIIICMTSAVKFITWKKCVFIKHNVNMHKKFWYG